MAAYENLEAGDRFVGRIPSSPLKTAILLDLTAKGIICLPDATAQMLSGSKVAQAMFLAKWMLPHTRAILGRRDLVRALNAYEQAAITRVVTKEDRSHCGHGLRFWPNLEAAFNVLGFDKRQEPFVLQPFLDEFIDIRVIWVDPYVEAYQRSNPGNFRKNLSHGGSSSPYKLNNTQMAFCRQVLEASKFPYAHLDLIIDPNGDCYLSEIALNGGIKGARIDRGSLDRMKRQKIEQLQKS